MNKDAPSPTQALVHDGANENDDEEDDDDDGDEDDEWLKPKLPMGRLHQLQGGAAPPTYLPPGRGTDGKRPDPTEYVYGDGILGEGYYSLLTQEAYILLLKRMRRAGALVQAEIDAYDCNNCFFQAPFKPSKTKQQEKQVFQTLHGEIKILTHLVNARYKAASPNAGIGRKDLAQYDIDPDEEFEDGFSMVHAVNDVPTIMGAVVSMLKTLAE